MLKYAIPFLIVLAAAATPARAEQIDNPEYVNWKRFKPGATVTVENVSKVAGNQTKMVVTTALKELTDKKAVLRMQTTMYVMGNVMQQPAQDREIPAKIDKPEMPPDTEKPDIKVENGEETLTIGDKQVACKWVKSTVKRGDSTITSKIWSSEAVPGGMVKMESSTEGAMNVETTMTVTEFKTE